MMGRLTKERNRLAKQIFLRKASTAIISIVKANEFMEELYGEEWDKEQSCSHSTKDNGISIYTDRKDVKWVRVKIFDEDFLISARNYKENIKTEFDWYNAVKIGTFNKKRSYLIAAYIDEINAKLIEIGGEPLASFCWSCTEYSSVIAWGVNFSNGCVHGKLKYNSFVVRPCKEFKS